MSNKLLSKQEMLLASQMSSAGIPLDAEVLEAWEAACRGLTIYQEPNEPGTRIFDLDSGKTGYMLSIAIRNDSPRTLWLHEYRLEIPWWEPSFQWLKDPWGKIPREHTYSFPDSTLIGFERDIVLNHRLGRRGRLCPGDWIEGSLLGVGEKPMPSGYQDRDPVAIKLWVLDEKGNRFGSDFKFLALRRELSLREKKLLEWRRSPEALARRRERRLDRLQQMRSGQPVPPPLKVDSWT